MFHSIFFPTEHTANLTAQPPSHLNGTSWLMPQKWLCQIQTPPLPNSLHHLTFMSLSYQTKGLGSAPHGYHSSHTPTTPTHTNHSTLCLPGCVGDSYKSLTKSQLVTFACCSLELNPSSSAAPLPKLLAAKPMSVCLPDQAPCTANSFEAIPVVGASPPWVTRHTGASVGCVVNTPSNLQPHQM